MDNNQQDQRDKALKALLARGAAFEEMVRTKGWEWVQAYFQEQIQSLANSLLLADDKPIGEFENKRRELIGLRKMLQNVESDLQHLEDYRKQSKEKKDEG